MEIAHTQKSRSFIKISKRKQFCCVLLQSYKECRYLHVHVSINSIFQPKPIVNDLYHLNKMYLPIKGNLKLTEKI